MPLSLRKRKPSKVASGQRPPKSKKKDSVQHQPTPAKTIHSDCVHNHEFVCLDCKFDICKDCWVKEHLQHKVNPIVVRQQNELRALMKKYNKGMRENVCKRMTDKIQLNRKFLVMLEMMRQNVTSALNDCEQFLSQNRRCDYIWRELEQWIQSPSGDLTDNPAVKQLEKFSEMCGKPLSGPLPQSEKDYFSNMKSLFEKYLPVVGEIRWTVQGVSSWSPDSDIESGVNNSLVAHNMRFQMTIEITEQSSG